MQAVIVDIPLGCTAPVEQRPQRISTQGQDSGLENQNSLAIAAELAASGGCVEYASVTWSQRRAPDFG